MDGKKHLTQRTKILNDITERDCRNNCSSEVLKEHYDVVSDVLFDLNCIFTEVSNKKDEDKNRVSAYFFPANDENVSPKNLSDDVQDVKGELYKGGDCFHPITYDYILDDLQRSGELYIKHEEIQHNFLDYLYIKATCYLYAQTIRNKVGFKLVFPHAGWRYNFYCKHIGNNILSVILGFLSSGFILFPLLIYVFAVWGERNSFFIVPLLLGVLLLLYKIVSSVFFLVKDVVFKKEYPYQTYFKKFVTIVLYLNNNIIEPQRLKELAKENDLLPPYIHVIISRMIRNNPELFDTQQEIFNDLYQKERLSKNKKVQEYKNLTESSSLVENNIKEEHSSVVSFSKFKK